MRFGEQSMQSACTHIKCNISDLAGVLRGYNIATDLMEIIGCIIISYLLTNLKSIAAVTILTHCSNVCSD